MSRPDSLWDAPCPHDLLWIDGPAGLIAEDRPPSWVRRTLAELPVVVVRRGARRAGAVPVGVRGRARQDRFAAFVAGFRISRRVSPEQLATLQDAPVRARCAAIPALRAVAQVRHAWAGIGLPWGPTGSVGFELATGVATATETSDLDLVIRAAQRFSVTEARAILAAVAHIDAVADIQVEAPLGAFALREYCDGRSAQCLVRTEDGPRLLRDPWSETPGDLA
jgi:phosphoribosyl-dephospho-CoA transferase